MLGALLVAEAIEKEPGKITEMLWACHVSTLCLCVGLVFCIRSSLAVALLFSLCVGLPSYIAELAFGGATTGLSVIEHIATPLLAYEAMRHRDWPRGVVATTMGMGVAVCGVSRGFTPPDLNINLVFRSWQTLEAHLPEAHLTLGPLLLLWWMVFWAGNSLLTRHFEKLHRPDSEPRGA